MKTLGFGLLLILSFCLGMIAVQPKIIELFISINWAEQSVANIAAIMAAIGTFSAVIVALKQSYEAKTETEKNRQEAINASKEQIKLYNNVLVSPPDMTNFFIGLTLTNIGQVPAQLQNLSCCFDTTSTHMLVTNEMMENWSAKLPYILPPGAKATFCINHMVLMNFARYAVQFGNGDPSNIKFLVSTNLETFYSEINKSITEKVKILIQQEKEYIDAQIVNSQRAQEEYDSNKDDGAWLTLFKNT